MTALLSVCKALCYMIIMFKRIGVNVCLHA